jgi:hypothetical protein
MSLNGNNTGICSSISAAPLFTFTAFLTGIPLVLSLLF